MNVVKLLIILLLPLASFAQEPTEVLPEGQVKLGYCVYSIGQRAADYPAWACVYFNPISVGSGQDMWNQVLSCQQEPKPAPAGQHAIWGNYIVLWKEYCWCPVNKELDSNDPRCKPCSDNPWVWAEDEECGDLQLHSVSWTNPTHNEPCSINPVEGCGTPLTDLAGIRLYDADNDEVLRDIEQTIPGAAVSVLFATPVRPPLCIYATAYDTAVLENGEPNESRPSGTVCESGDPDITQTETLEVVVNAP